VSSELKDRIQADLNQARKQRDRERTLVLSTALAEVKNREIESRGEIDDAGVVQVLSKGIKQRHDAAEQMRAGGRAELAEREEEQARVLQAYLPEALSEEEVRGMVREIVAGSGTRDGSQMGAVMGQLMPRIRGRFDGKEANRLVREELEAH
jgi:uncharacterized protein